MFHIKVGTMALKVPKIEVMVALAGFSKQFKSATFTVDKWSQNS